MKGVDGMRKGPRKVMEFFLRVSHRLEDNVNCDNKSLSILDIERAYEFDFIF
jgi:hypothetical protein